MFKKTMYGKGRPVVLGLALIVGGCATDGGPVVLTDDLLTPVNDDAELSVRVKRALRDAPRTAILRINVATVSDDTVRLTGFLNNKETIFEAERIASQVPGVRFVFNDLVVR